MAKTEIMKNGVGWLSPDPGTQQDFLDLSVAISQTIANFLLCFQKHHGCILGHQYLQALVF